MKALKNFEAAFVIAAALSIVASFATASTPVVKVAAGPAVVASADSAMPVVTITAKRLSKEEKSALI